MFTVFCIFRSMSAFLNNSIPCKMVVSQNSLCMGDSIPKANFESIFKMIVYLSGHMNLFSTMEEVQIDNHKDGNRVPGYKSIL